MVMPSLKLKMCIVKGPMAREQILNPAAIQIDIIECEANEICVPGLPYPHEERGDMPTELG